jgi:crotonobetainyl-CoA:carnitine CoA-transferase CaiB-like acyl-CoA transferase
MDQPDLHDLPLAGVKVLELAGGVSAAYATHLLAGYGADVVKVEPDGPLPPSLAPSEDAEVALDAGKRRVDVDAAELLALASVADIVVEDGPPGRLAQRGAPPDVIRRANPAAVIVSISPFGQSGPHRDWAADNLVSFAMGGIMSLTGEPSRTPLQTGGQQALQLGGLNGFAAALSGYFGASVHGEGDWVDISLQECAAGMLELYAPASALGLPAALRFGNYHRAVWALYPCADGYAGVFCLERQIRGLFAAIGEEVLQEERFLDPLQRAENDEELAAYVLSWMVDRDGEELLRTGRQYKVPFGKVRTPSELVSSPALVERGFFDTVTAADGRASAVPGRPFAGFAWHGGGELHERGADTEAVRKEWLGR